MILSYEEQSPSIDPDAWVAEDATVCGHPPKRRGYGTELIEGTCAHLGGEVELKYGPGGLTATIKIPA
ncbi:hypothetical protein RJJ63_03600 [Rhizobium hidalgonense]|uniref:hypothetical protein n=1 Tax=Rhizobium hidalgonense TaxID=1538159 RepID=UPI002871FEAD|nr:hypothetical protein [Rhizobium hidalgonense]MDR9818394.1 hypothetical protein [Rhizobium hidalgonense]